MCKQVSVENWQIKGHIPRSVGVSEDTIKNLYNYPDKST